MAEAPKVEPGDILFVTPRHNDPLALFVTELDGSRFSHCGIATRDGGIASCRAGVGVWSTEDTGGIRFDPYSAFVDQGRQIWHARVDVTAAEREDVLCWVEQFAQDGRNGAQGSAFSFAKLFLVSCGLKARSPTSGAPDDARDAVLDAAWEAADAAVFSLDAPTAFCSEFVGTAFGRGFDRAALDPPVMGGGGVESLPARWQGFLARVDRELRGARARWTFAELVGTVILHDLGHLLEVFETLEAWKEWKRTVPPMPPPELPDPTHPDALPPGGCTAPAPPPGSLPTALVTPRMLVEAPWTGEPHQVAGPT